MTLCPRCRAPAASGQEYCLECGLPLAGRQAARSRSVVSGWVSRSVLAALVALAGGAAAIAATSGGGGTAEVITATGGFATLPSSSTLPSPAGSASSGVADWPAGEDGWTIVLATLPQTRGSKPAIARARRARAKGLPGLGVLDSSRYASLRPGYWVVFSGVYASEAEATSALGFARKAARTATVRHVVP